MVTTKREFRPTTRYEKRFVSQDGIVLNDKGVQLKHTGTGYYSVRPVGKGAARTRRTLIQLALDAWYDTTVGIQIEAGNDFSPDNVVAFEEPDTVVVHNGLRWAHNDRMKCVVCEDGRTYHQNNYRLTQHNRGGVLLYSIDKTLYRHVLMMLEAFGYLTSPLMFDCSISKPLSLTEIMDSYNPNKKLRANQIGIHIPELITVNEYMQLDEVTFPVPITDDMIIAEFLGIKVTSCGHIVDKCGTKSVPYKLTQIVPTYKGIPIKFYVYNAFVIGNKQYDHKKIFCLDGNEHNTHYNNLESK